MTSRDFAFWLQGFFELSGDTGQGLTPAQADTVKRHLALVFKHEIDPSMGTPAHQADLNEIHSALQDAGVPLADAPAKPEPAWSKPPLKGGALLRC